MIKVDWKTKDCIYEGEREMWLSYCRELIEGLGRYVGSRNEGSRKKDGISGQGKLKGGIEQKREEVGSEVSRKDRKKSVAEWGKGEKRDGWEDEERGNKGRG